MSQKKEAKLKKFIEAYRKLSEEHGYDFVAKIVIDENGIRPIIRFIKNEDKKT